MLTEKLQHPVGLLVGIVESFVMYVFERLLTVQITLFCRVLFFVFAKNVKILFEHVF